MTRSFSPKWSHTVGLLVAATIAACGGGAGQGPAPSTPPEDRSDPAAGHAASALFVAVRVVPDEPRSEHVRLVAVVYDADGEETTADLGEHTASSVSDLPPLGADLLRLRAEYDGTPREIRLYRAGEHVEATARSGDGEERVLRRIPIPRGSVLQARDPAIER